MPGKYAYILVRIRKKNETSGAYPVEATLDDGSQFLDGELRVDMKKLLSAQIDAETYGMELFDALFTGKIRRAYDKVTGRAESEAKGRVRVCLWIDDGAAELHALPWERLYHIHKGHPVPLATSTLTPFSRFTGLEIAEPDPVRERPVRLLVAISNPKDLPSGLFAIEVEREVENLVLALGDLRRNSVIQVTLMPGRTGLSAELRAKLQSEGYQVVDGETSLSNIVRRLPHCHVFHFLGHGCFQRNSEHGEGMAALYLEKTDGTWEGVKDEDIVTKLAAVAPLPHLVFLAACESAKRDAEHPFVGLGPKLVKAGVPAVIAMQDVLPMDLARQCTNDFYRRLLEHGVVDRALNEGRLLLFDQKQINWAIPVLFMRSRMDQLFVADPVLTALQAIHADPNGYYRGKEEYLPLPMEVRHLVGNNDPGNFQRLGQEFGPSLDVVEATLGIFSKRGPREPERHAQPGTFVLLIGDHGTAKSTELRHIASITAEQSLRPNAGQRVIPVFVNLRDYLTLKASSRNSIETLILDSIRPFWPELTANELSDMLKSHEGPVFRILLDGSDDLPDMPRRDAWDDVQKFAHTYSRNEYMLSVGRNYDDTRRLSNATDLLVIQPLSRRKVRQFLQSLDDPAARRLYRSLNKTQLFDLATIPWLLIKMFRLARKGIYPKSRSEVLLNLIQDAVAEIPSERGMRARAEKTLYELAWGMQSSHSYTWELKEAFRIAAAVRGNREYSLEDLFDELAKCGLLVRVGQEATRFSYPVIQAYCCAHAILERSDRDRILDDISASLGRLPRLRWWEDTLVLLCGLISDPNLVLRSFIYGATLTEGEQVFLAVRCLLETHQRGIDFDLLHQVADALVWRIENRNEPRSFRRRRAAVALGQLQDPETIPALARAANQQVRINWKGKQDYELSSVRMAAAFALKQMMPKFSKDIHNADPQLIEILQMWQKRNVDALTRRLHSKAMAEQGLAAFALGDLQTPKAIDVLIETFFDANTKGETRWAVTDAMTLLDTALVTRRAVQPMLDERSARLARIPQETWNSRSKWYERLAYLIGKIRAQEPATRDFLDRCLFEFPDVGAKTRAILSFGELFDRRHKKIFEEIASGDFSKVAVGNGLSEQGATYLRRMAVEALANIGDDETLSRLRGQRSEWPHEVEKAFYWTSEEIFWRMSLSADR